MIQATKDMFSKYAVASGRTSRANFWWAVLGYFILSIIVGIITGLIGTIIGHLGGDAKSVSNIITWIWEIGTILPVFALDIRRLHDINKSGYWLLISLVPFVGAIVLLVFFCLPAVNEGNKY